jgi:hypothetical protein
MLGIIKNIEAIKIIPVRKSIQLAKSFNIPKLALINKSIPNIIRSVVGILIPAPNIKISPPMKSIAPKILTSIFFKSSCYLKIYHASVAQPGLEHFRPKERVVGSNPIGRVFFLI